MFACYFATRGYFWDSCFHGNKAYPTFRPMFVKMSEISLHKPSEKFSIFFYWVMCFFPQASSFAQLFNFLKNYPPKSLSQTVFHSNKVYRYVSSYALQISTMPWKLSLCISVSILLFLTTNISFSKAHSAQILLSTKIFTKHPFLVNM